jgi:hypothetical protein
VFAFFCHGMLDGWLEVMYGLVVVDTTSGHLLAQSLVAASEP